jgi:hypothetical protein
MVGKDGVVGVASALDSKIALTQAIVQLSGEAFVCEAAAFKGVAMQGPSRGGCRSLFSCRAGNTTPAPI